MVNSSIEPRSVEPSAATGGYQNNFGFIRLLLAILVVQQHACFVLDGHLQREPMVRAGLGYGLGTLGVFGFFSLSGYLITQSWARSPKLGRFIRNRVLRIYPGFLVAAVISVFVVGRIGSGPHYYEQFSVARVMKCLATLTIPEVEESFPGTAVQGVLNGSLWSIPAEFSCYVMVALAGLTHALSRRRLILGIFLLGLIVPPETIIRFFSSWLRNPYFNLLSQFLRMAPVFLCGVCAYLFRDRIHYTPKATIGASVLLLLALKLDVASRPALIVLGSYLLFGIAFARLPRLWNIGSGVDLSYGIYLYHWPVQLMIVWYWRELSPLLLFLLSLAGAAILAVGSWFLVEKPSLLLKNFPGGSLKAKHHLAGSGPG
jgi:peptidoglycan/LPS O-acetylase OafA/YrhL